MPNEPNADLLTAGTELVPVADAAEILAGTLHHRSGRVPRGAFVKA